MQYDSRRDWEVDMALARYDAADDAHDYSEYEPEREEEDEPDWYAEEGEAAYRLAIGR